jgi:DNA-binding NarL/FixJ family response regulator
MHTHSTAHAPIHPRAWRRSGRAAGTTRLVLAVPEELERKILRASLNAGRGFEVVADAHDSESATRFAHAHDPCVLVLDADIPGADAIDVMSGILEESPHSRIVLLTTSEDPATVRECIRAGALGYVLKWRIHDELPEAIRCAALGRAYLTPRLGARIAAQGGGEVIPEQL